MLLIQRIRLFCWLLFYAEFSGVSVLLFEGLELLDAVRVGDVGDLGLFSVLLVVDVDFLEDGGVELFL